MEVSAPPNGGWGYVIVLGGTLINIFNQSLLSVFGLLFGEYFTVLNESKTRIALVMNLTSAFLNLTGIITAPMLKNFSSRQVAISGSLLVSCGLMLTSFTTSLEQTIFTFSLMVGVGLGLIGPAIFIIISSYFTTRKSMAVGLALAGTGFGQMVMPQIVGLLLSAYGFRGTFLVLGSLALHGVVGACLFQPVRWHMRKNYTNSNGSNGIHERTPLITRRKSIELDTTTTTNCNRISFWSKIAETLDLELLKDVRFLILNMGLACAYVVSIDFMLVLPFFLQTTPKLNTQQTTVCMSVLAGFDLLSKLTFHFVTDRIQISHRMTFMIGVIAMGMVRSILAELTDYNLIIIACAFLGFFRAFVVVNQVLTLSEFCSRFYPDKLPGALGINMILKGVSVLSIGEILGWLRDVFGSYTISLHSQNILLSIVMIIWIIEFSCYRRNFI